MPRSVCHSARWRGLAERIEVGTLGDAAIEELLVTVLGGPVDAASVLQLADRSRGNPLYLRELVTGAVETGALAEQGGIWRLRADGLRPTARLAELVALRLGDLSDAERAVLELLALCEPLGQVRLDGLADPAAVEALERKGLIASRRRHECAARPGPPGPGPLRVRPPGHAGRRSRRRSGGRPRRLRQRDRRPRQRSP